MRELKHELASSVVTERNQEVPIALSTPKCSSPGGFLSPQWTTSGYLGFKSLFFIGENETETRGLERDPPQISWRV